MTTEDEKARLEARVRRLEHELRDLRRALLVLAEQVEERCRREGAT